jgi:hypothetical protein
MNIVYYLLFILAVIILLLIIQNYAKIPSRSGHLNRNKYNKRPTGNLTFVKDNQYIDDDGVTWLKRSFNNSTFHDPHNNYTFESYDEPNKSSSEVTINIRDFENGNHNFKTSTFNYYSSFRYPLEHMFADVLPSVIYMSNEYVSYE